jgi:hypothetical protein
LHFAPALREIFTGEEPSRFTAALPLRFLPGFHAVYRQVNILRLSEFKAAFIANQLFHVYSR